MRAKLAAPALAFLVAACQTVPPPPAATADNCAILSSSDWAAWINAMPGPDSRPKLIATGKVTVPTGGYTFAWRDLRVLRSQPVQVVAELEALPPDMPATQAVDTHDLRGEWPIDPPVGSLTITCNGRELARISPVETAQ